IVYGFFMTKIDSASPLFFHPLTASKVRAAGKLLASLAISIGTLGTLHLAVGCIKKYRVKHLNAPAPKTAWDELPKLHNNPHVIAPVKDLPGADTRIPNALVEAMNSDCPLGPKSEPNGHALVWVANEEAPASSHWVLVRRNPIYTELYEWFEMGARMKAAELRYQYPTQEEMTAYISSQDRETLTFTNKKENVPPWAAFCEDGKFIHARLGVVDGVPPRGMGVLLGVKR
ncbi:MAG: hypothetical protein ACK5MA_05465, partial [Parachlamydiaceae bacterium]